MQGELDIDSDSPSLKSKFSEEQIKIAEEQIVTKQKDSDYDIREYPIEVLIQKFTSNIDDDEAEIFIPDYQREMVWTVKQRARFIESILINLPIPYLFFADNDGRSEIVDGSQRIRTIAEFIQDDLVLRDLELLPGLNGFKFSDLPKSRQRRFNKKTIRLIEMTERMDEEARRQMFDRLNSGGTKLKPMEQRRGSRDGAFLTFVKEMSVHPLFIKTCPISDARLKHKENEEFVLRFFAYYENYRSFGHRVDDFLNGYVNDKNANPETDYDNLKDAFISMLSFVDENFNYGFKKDANNNSVPRIRFEAIAVGCALALEQNPSLKVSNIDWIFSKEFGHLTRSDASNSRPKVINRIHYVRDSLLGNEIEYEGDVDKIFTDPRKIDPQPDLFEDSSCE